MSRYSLHNQCNQWPSRDISTGVGLEGGISKKQKLDIFQILRGWMPPQATTVCPLCITSRAFQIEIRCKIIVNKNLDPYSTKKTKNLDPSLNFGVPSSSCQINMRKGHELSHDTFSTACWVWSTCLIIPWQHLSPTSCCTVPSHSTFIGYLTSERCTQTNTHFEAGWTMRGLTMFLQEIAVRVGLGNWIWE